MIMSVTGGHDDPCWNAFVTAMLAGGTADERPSRYGDKPALLIEGREIAHLEAPGIIDLRITSTGWSQARAAVSRAAMAASSVSSWWPWSR
jgi:hypothetical protein